MATHVALDAMRFDQVLMFSFKAVIIISHIQMCQIFTSILPNYSL